MKISQPYSSGRYLLKSFETVVESSLQEVKERFDEVDTRLDHIQRMDITEFTSLGGLAIAIMALVMIV